MINITFSETTKPGGCVHMAEAGAGNIKEQRIINYFLVVWSEGLVIQLYRANGVLWCQECVWRSKAAYVA